MDDEKKRRKGGLTDCGERSGGVLFRFLGILERGGGRGRLSFLVGGRGREGRKGKKGTKSNNRVEGG